MVRFTATFNPPTSSPNRVFDLLKVNGTVFSDKKKTEVTKTVSDFNSINSFSATFPNQAGEHRSSFNIGDDVQIFADLNVNLPVTKIFSGMIEDVEYSGEGVFEEITISGRDYALLLMDTTVSPVTYNNQEVSLIVKDIISNNVSGITSTNVDATSTTITHIAFNHISVFDAIKQLADQAGFFFWVDVNQDLNFKRKGAISSGISFDNTNVETSNFRVSDADVYNNVYVYGDRYLTSWKNSFTANGGSVYTLDYNPYNTQVLVGGSTAPKRGGVYQMVSFAPTGTQYLVDFNNKNIIFVSGTDAGNNIPVSGTDAISVNYDRSTPIAKYVHDNPSEVAYKKKTKVIIDKNIKDPRMAKDLALTFLNDHKDPKIQGELSVFGVVNVSPGQTVSVNLPYEGIVNQVYDVIECSYVFTKENNLLCKVLKVTLNKKLPNIIDSIKQVMLDIKKIQAQDISSYDVISRLDSATGSVGVRVKSWVVQSWTIGSSLYVGSPSSPNGWVGSPGSFWVSSGTKTYTTLTSGGEL